MRSIGDRDQFTPVGIWLREYLRQSHDGLSITNLDYVLEDFKRKRVMLLEEKQSNGTLHKAQTLTFRVLDGAMRVGAAKAGYDYWGFFVLRLPANATMPGPGMTLNGSVITSEQLRAHLNFDEKFCEGYCFDDVEKKWGLGLMKGVA